MSFLGVYRAIYDYAPQDDGELELTEGDLLFVLEKSTTDDWWKAKKKAASEDDDEPDGLIPNNYVQEADPIYTAKALYDYSSQTEEELSLNEEDQLHVFDDSDPNWTLVGVRGSYGFAPSTYIEKLDHHTTPALPTRPHLSTSPAQPLHTSNSHQSPPASPLPEPAKALAGIIAQRTGQSQAAFEPPSPQLPQRPRFTPDQSDNEAGPAPPPKDNLTPITASRIPSFRQDPPRTRSPPRTTPVYAHEQDDADRSPQGYHLYNVHETVSHMGKNKKMPTILGVNISRGIISIAPAKARDGPQQEWTAEKLSHYSIEGKHVFMELIRPSRSLELHAGSKDTAYEIVAGLGELAGAARAGGLREVIAAGSGATGTKKGHMLYEFLAQGDDEVTVATGDEIIVLDDTKSDEWWMVRRLRSGKEGVVPSSYVEITSIIPMPSPSYTGAIPGRSIVEQNQLEEERLTREAVQNHKRQGSENGLPEKQRSDRTNGKRNDKPKPNRAKVRTWTDRTASFKVEAEFIGLRDGKIHLHKLNGVKIAVPVNKMAVDDLEYVERVAGVSLDDDKPLSDIKRRSSTRAKNHSIDATPTRSSAGLKKPEHDWFDFFLAAGVNPQICERYANAFQKDQMGEEILPDVNPQLLRTLGLKEGDIIRVMKLLDAKFNRTRAVTDGKASDESAPLSSASEASNGGLFSGPGGALKNNTRKGRPAPAVQTNDVIDSSALKHGTNGTTKPDQHVSRSATAAGFDDNAWDVKPSSVPTSVSAPVSAAPQPKPHNVMDDLSTLVAPLQPTPAPAPQPQTQQQQPAAPSQPEQTARPSADPAFFDRLGAPAPLQSLQPQTTGRQRPLAPQPTAGASLIPPPPRAASAPNFAVQATGVVPQSMQPQQTGFQALPGQSMQTLQQQQQQQQQYGIQQPYTPQAIPQQQQPQMTGYPMQAGVVMPQQTGYAQPAFMQSNGNPTLQQQQALPPNVFQQPQAMQQQFVAGQMTGSPFADPPRAPFQPQPTGFPQNQFTGQPVIQSQPTGYGLPPQQTGGVLGPAMLPQRTGMNGFATQPQSQFGQQLTAQQTGGFNNAPQPLIAQRTGPTPNVRFGVQNPAKLTPQATGRRANLSNATPQNPFGF